LARVQPLPDEYLAEAMIFCTLLSQQDKEVVALDTIGNQSTYTLFTGVNATKI